MSISTFDELRLSAPLTQALTKIGYKEPTPIQSQAIPPLLEGRDLLGIAQTGTGKTAAFGLPILDYIERNPRKVGRKAARALIVTPTRELASQIEDNLKDYAQYIKKVRCTVVFGGVGQNPQVKAMQNGVEILVATPGRLLDLMDQGYIRLDELEIFVLDEADRMLDMGFIHDVRKIVAAIPKTGVQTLLFSATMPDEIAGLAKKMMKDPVRVEVTPPSTTVEKIDQRVHFVAKRDKRRLLKSLLINEDIPRALVFTRTKHGANRVAGDLAKAKISAAAIHGNKSQTAREKALAQFRGGKVRVLVATDIAARGIDVDGISHVINYDLPNIPESYVHRIGRTARAGREGSAISFCDSEESAYLLDIEKQISQSVPRDSGHQWHCEIAEEAAVPKQQRQPQRQQSKPKPKSQGQRRGGPSKPQAKASGGNKPQSQGQRAQTSEGGKTEGRRRRRRRPRRSGGGGQSKDNAGNRVSAQA